MKKTPGPDKAEPSAPSKRKSSSKSTATEAQRGRILALLRMRPHNGYELRRAGCYQCPTRIFELRARGYTIETSRVAIVDHDGFTHAGVALYSLTAEPLVETPPVGRPAQGLLFSNGVAA